MTQDTFKYYTKPLISLDSANNAFKIIEKEKLIIDSKYVEVIEAAENGYCTAWIELQEGFATGNKGLPKNYKMARYYTDIMIKGCTTIYNDPIMLFESYRASSYLELDHNNTEDAIADLTKALKIMVNDIPSERWDYTLLTTLYNLQFPAQ